MCYRSSGGVAHRRVCQLVWVRRAVHESVAVERMVQALNRPPGGCAPKPGPWVAVRRTGELPAEAEGVLPDVVEFGVQLAGGLEALVVWWCPVPRDVNQWTGRLVAGLNPFLGLESVELDMAGVAA